MQVHIWDAASGMEVREVTGSEFDLVAEEVKSSHKTDRHLLTASGVTLRITELPPRGGPERSNRETFFQALLTAQQQRGESVAFFKAPQRITSVRSQGATVCVGCDGGAVCILSAPFLAV